MIRLLLLISILSQNDPAAQARALIEKLRSDSIEEREAASAKLKDLGKAAQPALERATQDKDTEVAERAKYILKVISIREKLTPAILKVLPGIDERLASGDDRIYRKVFLDVASTAPARALDVLAPAAIRGAKGYNELKPIFEIVERRHLRSAAPALIGLLGDAQQGIRYRAVRLLGEIGVKTGVQEIAASLKDPDDGVRAEAAETLGKLEAQEAVPALVEALSDSEASVRERAAEALGKIRSPEAVAAVVERLKDTDLDVRRRAIEALGEIGGAEAVNEIRALLKDPDSNVSSSAARVLGRMGAREAIPDLAGALREGDGRLHQWAVTALADLNATDRILDIAHLLEAMEGSHAPYVRGEAAISLARLHARTEVEKIAKLLSDPAVHTRGRAAQALGLLGAKETIPAISQLLEQDWLAASPAIRALADLDAKAEVPAIVKALGNANVYVRSSAATALGQLDAVERDGDLVKALADSRVQVRLAAAEALCLLRRPEGVPVLLKECSDRSWPILEAGGSLSMAKSPRILNVLRRRDVWARLRSITVPWNLKGTRKEVAGKLAKDAAMPLEWSPAITPDEDAWISGRRTTVKGWKPRTLFDELGALAQGQPVGSKSPRYEIILEADRIRVVTYDEALVFWEAWWADERKSR